MIASRETLLSLLYRIGTIAVSFVSVSYLVKSLGVERYGAWATLVSALVWIQMSDLGIGYVIKNRVAAGGDPQELCDQIAGSVFLSSLIGLALVALYGLFWREISVARDFPFEASVLYLTAFLSLPTMIGINVLQGLGLTSVGFLATLVQSVAWLLFIVLLGQNISLHLLAVGFSSLWLLNGTYSFFRGYRALKLGSFQFGKRLRSAHRVRRLYPLLKIGGSFFVLQLSGLMLFNLGAYLAYTNFSATAAAKYDILNKIYQIPMTLFNVVITIAWARAATLISQREGTQVAKIQTQLLAASVGSGIALLIIGFFAVPRFVRAYSHGQLTVTLPEVLWFAAQICIQMIAYAGAVFMNAAERLRIQIAFAVMSAALFLPIFFALKSAGMGIAAIPVATLVVVLPGAAYFNYFARGHIIAPLTA